jgi:hypothetical protein
MELPLEVFLEGDDDEAWPRRVQVLTLFRTAPAERHECAEFSIQLSANRLHYYLNI